MDTHGETLGQRIRRMREEQGLTQAALARITRYDRAQISRAENDTRCSLEVARAIDVALEAGGCLLEMASGMAPATTAAYPDDIVMAIITIEGTTMSIPIERRAILGILGAAGITTATSAPAFATPSPHVSLTALDQQLDRYAALGRVTSPDEVSALLVPHIAAIDQMRRNAPAGLRRDLLILGSRYAEFTGWMRQEAGDPHGAAYWTDRAAEWAVAADWADMAPYALIRKASLAWYAGDWAQGVDLARAAARMARTPGVRVQAILEEASGYSMMARVSDTERALDAARDLAGRWRPEDEPPLGPTSERPSAQVEHRAATCWVNVGRPDDAIEVYERALGAVAADGSRLAAKYQSRLALAYARAGTPDRAVILADQALSRVERVRSASVAYGLRDLTEALSRWRDRDDVRDITHRVRELTA